MTDLEFIEFYIKEYKRSVEWYKKYQEKNPTSFVNTLKEEELILHHLQQIKAKLEAWEICKNKKVDMLNVMYSANAEVYNCCLFKDHRLTEEELETIKKALEAKNECRN